MQSFNFQQVCSDHAALKPVRYNTIRGDLNQINEGEKKNGKGTRIEKYDSSFRPVQFRRGFFIDDYPLQNRDCRDLRWVPIPQAKGKSRYRNKAEM